MKKQNTSNQTVATKLTNEMHIVSKSDEIAEPPSPKALTFRAKNFINANRNQVNTKYGKTEKQNPNLDIRNE